MDNREIAERYLKYINDNYDYQLDKLKKYISNKKYIWDDDIFSDTILKVYDKILKYGMEDDTSQGFDNYTFLAFKTNVLREAQYSRNAKRDSNVKNVSELYEQYYNSTNDSSVEKIRKDLFNDFAVLYIMKKVEENFDDISFYCYRLKAFVPHMTYKRLQEVTKIKGARTKVVNVKNWLKENVTKDEIKKAFNEIYSDLLEND